MWARAPAEQVWSGVAAGRQLQYVVFPGCLQAASFTPVVLPWRSTSMHLEHNYAASCFAGCIFLQLEVKGVSTSKAANATETCKKQCR